MHKLLLLFTLLLAMPASAKDEGRCGTDAFGNDVCMDKDGVLSNAPAKPVLKRSGNETGAVRAGSKVETGDQPGSEEKNRKPRCGTDPFGNTVCSQ
jgi:hypothetical protein